MTEDSLAGYKRLRPIAEKQHARLFLGRREADAGYGSDPQLWGLTCFAPATPNTAALTEAECRDRARSDHTVGLDDVASGSDGTPILIHRWSQSGTLRRLLRERSSLRVGEAISVLAPLVHATKRSHDAGVALGAISIDSVEFDERGAPVFADFSKARLVSAVTPAQLAALSEIVDDRRQLFALCSSVLAAVSSDLDGERRRRELDEWLSAVESAHSPHWDSQLEQRLFSLGAPEPIQLVGDTANDQHAHHDGAAILDGLAHVAARDRGRIEPTVSRETHARKDNATVDFSRPSFSEFERSTALPRWISVQLHEWRDLMTQRSQRIRQLFAAWIAPVRKRTWVVALFGLVALSLAAALSVVPSNAEQSASSTQGWSESTKAAPRDDGDAPPLSSSSIGMADAPEDALELLLAAREVCVRDLSIECLESVSSVDSPAYRSDAELIAAALGGAELPETLLFDASKAVEVQRLGDSILFDFEPSQYSKPASLLLVKGEAGWRIRSYSLPEE